MVARIATPAIVVALLLLAPAAGAMPMREHVNAPEPTPTPDVVITRASDFAWSEALLGAGIATALCCLLFAAMVRRRHATGMALGDS